MFPLFGVLESMQPLLSSVISGGISTLDGANENELFSHSHTLSHRPMQKGRGVMNTSYCKPDFLLLKFFDPRELNKLRYLVGHSLRYLSVGSLAVVTWVTK